MPDEWGMLSTQEDQDDWRESYRIVVDQCANLLVALGDAIHSPEGVVPPSAKPYVALIATARSKQSL